MSWKSGMGAVVLLAFFPLAGRADSISFNSGSPSGGTGSVTASGSVTVSSGNAFSGITIYVATTCECGGQGGQASAMVTMMTECGPTNWTGTVSCLPSGTYTVWARLYTISEECETMNYTDTPMQTVTVE